MDLSCWYSTEAGQWLSQDPLGYVDSFNSYAFNKFDPVNFVDPWGLQSEEAQNWCKANPGQCGGAGIGDEVVVTGHVECDSKCQDRAERQQQKMMDRADDAVRNSGTRAGPAAQSNETLSRPRMSPRMRSSVALRKAGDAVAGWQRRWKVTFESLWRQLVTGEEEMNAGTTAGVVALSLRLGGAGAGGAGPRLGAARGGVGVLSLERQLAQLMAARRAAALAAAAAGATVVMSQGGDGEKPTEPTPQPAKPEKPPDPISPTEETLSRLGTDRESAGRLGRKAAEAEGQIGIHGVSTTAGTPKGPASQAARTEVEQAFKVHDTPTRNDPLHRTVELPKPVTTQVAELFNKIFGR